MFLMIVGSTIGGLAPMAYGGGWIAQTLGALIGGAAGIWAGLRLNEWMT